MAGLTPEFEIQLQQAEAAQEERREPLVGLESWIIELSPKTRLTNGDGDISTIGETKSCVSRFAPIIGANTSSSLVHAGDCAGDIDSFCSTVTAGRRRLADCLQLQVANEQTGNVQGVFRHLLPPCTATASTHCVPELAGRTVKEDCVTELADFQADLTSNVNKDIPLGELILHAQISLTGFSTLLYQASTFKTSTVAAAIACEVDATRLCADLAEDSLEAAVSSCLWSVLLLLWHTWMHLPAWHAFAFKANEPAMFLPADRLLYKEFGTRKSLLANTVVNCSAVVTLLPPKPNFDVGLAPLYYMLLSILPSELLDLDWHLAVTAPESMCCRSQRDQLTSNCSAEVLAKQELVRCLLNDHASAFQLAVSTA